MGLVRTSLWYTTLGPWVVFPALLKMKSGLIVTFASIEQGAWLRSMSLPNFSMMACGCHLPTCDLKWKRLSLFTLTCAQSSIAWLWMLQTTVMNYFLIDWFIFICWVDFNVAKLLVVLARFENSLVPCLSQQTICLELGRLALYWCNEQDCHIHGWFGWLRITVYEATGSLCFGHWRVRLYSGWICY